MAKFYDRIEDKLAKFISAQPMFFVATAPKEGRISLSPKGMDTFRVLGPNQLAWLDFVGSGNETAAHLLDDGRITIMFNSFSSIPMILRLYGHGRSVKPGDKEFDSLMAHFTAQKGIRQIFIADIGSVQTSCGYGVPEMELKGQRDTLENWCERKSDQELLDYQREKNRQSIDGLPTGL
ncbi:pyridoxamine 5'-phosphate oxidase family protein [Emcibacter nanhaiensis]|uniref:Pyridoxamine 5'-phosphate oxidase family protein n=1 Tax=Emcibacter nanhaiensis TaxID=1505037 RepID=A0A501PCC2_9PROT|nr:pyridoxamine 5'-phosphate oxidase family protein [Emcibacter nanhaiensis]TPD57672.1 pyridoxamine 5'-phosphate oxidase family protein [Emcibacter nanhaiensis]